MIPREILKKIRQIELRTNRIVQISSPVFQLFRFAACVEDGQNHDAFGFNQKMDYKRKTTENNCAPDFTTNFWKPFWMVGDALKVLLDGGAKFLTQAFTLAFIIGNGIVKFLFGNATEDEAAFHLRYFASSFALTSANETTSSGFSRWSWRRRSISSASPGVSSCESTMPSQRLRHSSICSANGRARASLKIVSELMELNLPPLNIFASA
jgi:hypothetical protein